MPRPDLALFCSGSYIFRYRDRVSARRLAASLTLPALRWFAVGNMPDLTEEMELARHHSGVQTMKPDGTIENIVANINDHLHESEDPVLLDQYEASLMFHAGSELIRKALNATDTQLQDEAYELRASRVDLLTLKAGVQLVVDAYFSDEKSKRHETADIFVFGRAAEFLNTPQRMEGFCHSALQFFFCTYHMLPGIEGQEVSRQMLDKLLSLDVNEISKVRRSSPIRRWTLARLLFFRSSDKLIRLHTMPKVPKQT